MKKLRTLLLVGLSGSAVAAMAQFQGRIVAGAGYVDPFVQTVNGMPSYALTHKVENVYGGDGGATSNLVFSSGTLGVSTHGCASPNLDFPTVNYRTDGGNGTARSMAQLQEMTVRSDTLPRNTVVNLKFCINAAVMVSSVLRVPSQVTNLSSESSFFFGVSSKFSVAGSLRVVGLDTHLTSSGVFNAMEGSQEYFHTFEVTEKVGVPFFITLQADSDSYANCFSVRTNDGILAGFSSASSGIGVTCGLDSITDGTYLFSTTTQSQWTGTCGGASGYIPPNPVHFGAPEPAAFIPLGMGLAIVIRRKGGKGRAA